MLSSLMLSAVPFLITGLSFINIISIIPCRNGTLVVYTLRTSQSNIKCYNNKCLLLLAKNAIASTRVPGISFDNNVILSRKWDDAYKEYGANQTYLITVKIPNAIVKPVVGRRLRGDVKTNVIGISSGLPIGEKYYLCSSVSISKGIDYYLPDRYYACSLIIPDQYILFHCLLMLIR